MKRSIGIISLGMALGVTAMAQTTTPPPPQATPTKHHTETSHPKAKGAAAGAAIGAMTGNAGKGALIGAGHSRREARRAKRHE
jgi:hypothetical protein